MLAGLDYPGAWVEYRDICPYVNCGNKWTYARWFSQLKPQKTRKKKT